MVFNPILKRLFFLITCSLALPLVAQNVEVRRAKQRQEVKQSEDLSRNILNYNLDNSQGEATHRWEKTIYRRLDLTKPENAVLLDERASDKGNLFTQIFKLLNAGTIEAYDYVDGREYYDEAHRLDFKAFLERFQIPYKAQKRRGQALGNNAYEVSDLDIPSSEVRAYYIKEVWSFDQNQSDFTVQIEAVCPILSSIGDYGDMHYPLFWLPYNSLRPHIDLEKITLDDANTSAQASLDDYFTLRLYQGDIVQVKNRRNQSLVQQYGADALQQKRDSLELYLDSLPQRFFQHKKFRAELEKEEDKAEAKEVKPKPQPKKTSRKKAKSRTVGRSVRGRF